MDHSSIDLTGTEIESIELVDGTLTIRFSRAYIVKTMTGSKEKTRWWQTGALILEGAEVDGDIPIGPLVCAGGDVTENVYTYRDMIPVPLQSRGRTGCKLRFQGSAHPLIAHGEAIRLEMVDRPYYIEHIRD